VHGTVPGKADTARLVPVGDPGDARRIGDSEGELGVDGLVGLKRVADAILVFGADAEAVLLVRLQAYHVVVAASDKRAHLHPSLKQKYSSYTICAKGKKIYLKKKVFCLLILKSGILKLINFRLTHYRPAKPFGNRKIYF